MGGSLSDICDRGAGGAKQTTNLIIEKKISVIVGVLEPLEPPGYATVTC
jgi:hypothetical protein